jgi:putative restriction endonuclease
MALGDYVQTFRKLRVNAGSPHKPIMLLALIQLFDEGKVPENEIYFDQDLLDTYRALFRVVASPTDHPNPYFPFFHLKNDGGDAPFWRLIPIPGRELFLRSMRSARSRADIIENVARAELAPELFLLLRDPVSRALLRREIIQTWFPAFAPLLEAALKRESNIAAYMDALREMAEKPLAPGIPDSAEVPKETRDPAFSRVVRAAYDNRCAASGWRIILPDGAAMVQAAHLIPFSDTQDDDPRNGIALSPTFHWALDRFLIAPGPDLKWHVSSALDSRIRDNAELLAFNGKNLLLPQNKKYWPRAECLDWRLQHLLK